METQIRGGLATPGEPGYRRAQPWNLAVPVDPGIVVPAADGADVAETMRFAAERGLRVAVQATGHGAVALDEHDLLIHTGALDTLMIDPERRIARVGAGVSSQQ